MKFLPDRSLYNLLVSSANSDVHLPKHVVIVRSRYTLCTIVDCKINPCQLQIVDKQVMNAINLFVTNSRLKLLREAKKDDPESTYWRYSIKISEEYGEYRKALLHMLALFQTISGLHLRIINTHNYQNEMISLYIQPMHSAPYQAGPNNGRLANERNRKHVRSRND